MPYFTMCTRVYDNDKNFNLYVYNIVYTFLLISQIYKQEWDFSFELISSVAYTHPLIRHIEYFNNVIFNSGILNFLCKIININGYIILTNKVSWTQPHVSHMSVAELLTQVVTQW